MSKIIFKIGGSILSTKENNCIDFNVEYVRKFAYLLISNHIDAGMIIGGGYLNKYMLEIIYNRLGNESVLTNFYHSIGIASLNLNANMFLTIFMHEVHKLHIKLGVLDHVLAYKEFEYLKDLNLKDYNYFVAGAYKVGHSSDMDALMMADEIDTDLIISLKNIDGVYSKDPYKYADAKFFSRLSWDEYFDIIKTKEFNPRGNFPVDPITATKARKLNKKFVILEGGSIFDNIDKIVNRDFEHIRCTVLGN